MTEETGKTGGGEKTKKRLMIIVATTSLPAVDRPNANRWNAARSCQNEFDTAQPSSKSAERGNTNLRSRIVVNIALFKLTSSSSLSSLKVA